MRLAAALVLAWLAGAAPARAHDVAPVPALEYEPPAPGTYVLQRIMPAPDGEVLGLDGRPQPLGRFTSGRITLLGFIYTTCVDPDGCPFAYRVFDALRPAIGGRPEMRGKVRLVTLSFDPEHDTPAAMRAYAGRRVTEDHTGVPWHFFTTRSVRALAPLREGFGQDVRSARGLSGRRELSHVLKVFLIDDAGIIREIYDSTFLHPQVVLNDIETLLMTR
jgi:cytochrome oxidase Cu insertion factor (SCO1/SenC/PrrC family)